MSDDKMPKRFPKNKLITESIPHTSMWIIKKDGAGRLPAHLQGQYTARHLAEQAIESYIMTGN